ncbi:MAG: PD-(D/E)XK nuclease family protein [Methylophilaceae bacterium]
MRLDSIILCPTARLARSIQLDIAKQHARNGQAQWQTANVQTLSQWLQSVIQTAQLTGALPVNQPVFALSAFNEQLLWQEAITQSLKNNAFGALFDVAGLAATAMEANQYCVAWQLHLPHEQLAEESRQFLQWQRAFTARCKSLNVLEQVRYVDWQLAQLTHAAVLLPAQIAFAGFDQAAPQELRLREILSQRGVQVTEYATKLLQPALTQHLSLQNQEAECRAAVAWAQASLLENPQATLAIVAPQLNEIRNQLTDLLDDTFYPHTLRPSMFDAPRNYNVSLGTPLAQQPIIQAALNLLRLLSRYPLLQVDVSSVLLSPFWSASQQEADARAILDARLREKMPMQFSLNSLIAFAQQQLESGLPIVQLVTHLQAAKAQVNTKKANPTQWVQNLTLLLGALHWPGERNITSLEYQAMNAWQKTLQQLAQLEMLGKTFGLQQAVSLMQQICTNMIFQAETEHAPAIQILGMMEALSQPVDAMWCMHMNDHIWPPPARPNPLLPAFIQRAARLPNADIAVQAAFAQTIHQRLLHSAKTIIFSSSQSAGESQLRASPLMIDIPKVALEMPQVFTLAEQLSKLGNADLTLLDDHIAPVIRADEHVRGGTGLFKAQAICPAWAFYQYRLGAKALKSPVNGLDSMQRGSLVHGVLEQFWLKRHFADLRDMPAENLALALNQAVTHTLNDFASENIISPNVIGLEHERLIQLIGDWLAYEKSRGVAFNIIACEDEKKVTICGIEITLKIDRIHALANGGQEFVDYKTGQVPKMSSWGEDRITEPQLPIYAVFYEAQAPAVGVHFGMVKTAEHAFKGLSEADFEGERDKRKPAFIRQFSDWAALLTHWKTSIEAIADEIKTGFAPVRLNDESELAYCEVRLLLRLPERQLQFEREDRGVINTE